MNTTTAPTFTHDQLEAVAKIGFEGAVKYPGVETWDKLALSERNLIVDRLGKEITNAGSYGTSGPSNR